MKNNFTALFLFLCATVQAASLSLTSADDYVFTDVRCTNLIHGVGMGTNVLEKSSSAVTNGPSFPLRYEDVAFSFEAAEERRKTSDANSTTDNSDGSFIFDKTSRRMGVIPNESDIYHVYESIWVPLSHGSPDYLLSQDLEDLTVCTFTNIGVTSAAWMIPTSTNDAWIGYNDFRHDIQGKGFRRVISVTNFQRYVYQNLEASRFIKSVRYGFTGIHSNRIDTSSEGISYLFSDQRGWVKYEYGPEVYHSWSSPSSGNVFNESYRYRRTISKYTYEYWTHETGDEWKYEGYRNGYNDGIWKSDNVVLPVTIFFALTNSQEITSVEHAGAVVDFTHFRQIRDVDRGTTNVTLGTGRYFIPLTSGEFTLSDDKKKLCYTIEYDSVARDILNRVGSEPHPSESAPILFSEIEYPPALADRQKSYTRNNYAIDDLEMKVKYFSFIVGIKWNARLENNEANQ